MDIHKPIDDQILFDDEKRLLEDWLTRIADGRLKVYVPTEIFGCKLGDEPDVSKLLEVCDKLKSKIALARVIP